MDVSEHLQRELIYHLNAALIRGGPHVDADVLTQVFIDTVRAHGPRFHEPDLFGAWAEEAELDPEELVELLWDIMPIVVDELNDDEALWSAHRVLELLAEESFWVLSWGLPGEDLPPPPLVPARGVPLPLAMRPGMVRILDVLEVTLHEARQEQRSVHDPVPAKLIEEALEEALASLQRLARSFGGRGAPAEIGTAMRLDRAGLPDLRQALRVIQGWKLAVEFDAHPDEDDGEWTLRVLERLYGLQWVVSTVVPAA